MSNLMYSTIEKFLDRDPSRFKLSDIETQRRRRLFWELHISDMWIVSQFTETSGEHLLKFGQAFATGRPPSIPHAHVDTKMPVYPEDDYRTDGCTCINHFIPSLPAKQ
jgi:hypothetical protein